MTEFQTMVIHYAETLCLAAGVLTGFAAVLLISLYVAIKVHK